MIKTAEEQQPNRNKSCTNTIATNVDVVRSRGYVCRQRTGGVRDGWPQRLHREPRHRHRRLAMDRDPEVAANSVEQAELGALVVADLHTEFIGPAGLVKAVD